MHNETITVTLEVPDGYELTGEFRKTLGGETILKNGVASPTMRETCFEYFILRNTTQPYKFPDWMPDGWILSQYGKYTDAGWLLYNPEAGHYLDISGLIFDKPTDDQLKINNVVTR